MKVIYLSNSVGQKSNGGSSLSGLRFLQLLEKKYDQVTLVTDEWRSPPASIGQRTVELARVDIGPVSWSLRQFAKFLILSFVNFRRRPKVIINVGREDVILIANSFTTLEGKLVIQTQGKIRKVCVVRGDTNSFIYQPWDDQAPDFLAKPKDFLQRFDAIIYVSKTILSNWTSAGVNTNHWYLPNAISEQEVARVKTSSVGETRRRLSMSSSSFHIVVIGSIQERKGQDLFSAIADQLLVAIPNVQVHFVGVVSAMFGGGRIAATLQKVGQGRFIIHGHKDNALEYAYAADIVVSTSRSEAFPRTVAEYLALACPIISTRVAGADEMIEHQRNGLLIEIDDADALLEGIRNLANDPETRRLFGVEAELTYKHRYSEEQQEKRFIEIFDQIECL